MKIATAHHAPVDLLAMKVDFLVHIHYVRLDIFVDVVQIVRHLTLELMRMFACLDIIVQKVSPSH